MSCEITSSITLPGQKPLEAIRCLWPECPLDYYKHPGSPLEHHHIQTLPTYYKNDAIESKPVAFIERRNNKRALRHSVYQVFDFDIHQSKFSHPPKLVKLVNICFSSEDHTCSASKYASTSAHACISTAKASLVLPLMDFDSRQNVLRVESSPPPQMEDLSFQIVQPRIWVGNDGQAVSDDQCDEHIGLLCHPFQGQPPSRPGIDYEGHLALPGGLNQTRLLTT